MKNKLFALLLLFSVTCFAQENNNDSIAKKPIKFRTYAGFAGNMNDNLNLNTNLKNSNLVQLGDAIPEFNFGLNYYWKQYSGDVEFGFLYATPDNKNNTAMKYRGFNTRVRLHYNLIDREKIAFTTGLSVSYLGSEYDIFSTNNTIDLNDLNPDNNSGHVSFTNEMLYIGPSASLYLFKKSNLQVRLNVGYELALTRGRYKSEFGSILNNINEAGNNRLLFGITIL